MGDVADMMLDGILCQGCGGFIGEAVDYPRYCSDCEPDEERFVKVNASSKVECPECGKKVHELGLNQHIAAKH